MIPIDPSVEHYLEERALAIALAMAGTLEEQAAIEHLVDLRTALMEHREAHSNVSATAPSREEMDAKVKGLYLQQGTSKDVLKAHARIHFARELQAREESFVRAWIDAVGDPSFVDQLRVLQREASVALVTAATNDPRASSSPPRTDDRNR